jgi:rhamnosyltransferase
MRAGTVTVAIPVYNGGQDLARVLSAVRAQEIDRAVQLLIVDSGSTDGSVELARSSGADVVEIRPAEFSHGGTRNLLMQLAEGEHVAFLSQDAVPAHHRWLSRLIEGFDEADDVALVFGPYIPRPDASPMVKRELTEFFSGFAGGEGPLLQRLEPGAAAVRSPSLLTFFSDANGCLARATWERVPYRDVPYAEDQLLAVELLEAGYAKVFHPGAGVVHSHDYSTVTYFRRCFDEWRALREIYGHVESARPRRVISQIYRGVTGDRAYMRNNGAPGSVLAIDTMRSLRYHLTRSLGSLAGSRADRFPSRLRRLLSLEGRATFAPQPLSGSQHH